MLFRSISLKSVGLPIGCDAGQTYKASLFEDAGGTLGTKIAESPEVTASNPQTLFVNLPFDTAYGWATGQPNLLFCLTRTDNGNAGPINAPVGTRAYWLPNAFIGCTAAFRYILTTNPAEGDVIHTADNYNLCFAAQYDLIGVA